MDPADRARPLTYKEVRELESLGFGKKELSRDEGNRLFDYVIECILGDENYDDYAYPDLLRLYRKTIDLTYPTEEELKNS